MEAPKQTIVRAKALRRRMTPRETRLWVVLRGRKLEGLRFRRQHPIGPYVLDFYCDSARVAIEVDGDIHGSDARIVHDRRRDAWLGGQGVRTLRVWAADVFENLDGVVLTIARAARDEA